MRASCRRPAWKADRVAGIVNRWVLSPRRGRFVKFAPTIRMSCPPPAATVSARLAISWLRTFGEIDLVGRQGAEQLVEPGRLGLDLDFALPSGTYRRAVGPASHRAVSASPGRCPGLGERGPLRGGLTNSPDIFHRRGKAVGWVERSEPRREIRAKLVGLASLDPPYPSSVPTPPAGARGKEIILHPPRVPGRETARRSLTAAGPRPSVSPAADRRRSARSEAGRASGSGWP